MSHVANSPPARREAVFERLSRLVSALAAPVRLKLVQLLGQSPRDVETLARTTGESVANVSQHLRRMAREGVVEGTVHRNLSSSGT